MKVIVTGADGFIGSHLTEALVRSGHDVRAFVLYNSFNSWGWLDESPPEIRQAVEVYAGDVRDPDGVRDAVEGVDAVLHLAAVVAIPHSYRFPASHVDTNVRGTLNVLLAARDAGVSRFVHTSTSEVYGTARFVPITEEHPLQGQSPYSASKIGADQLANAFHASFGLPVVTLRPFNTYGPRQSARAVIPSIVTQIASGREVLRLGALEPTRDFTFVTDTVAAFLAALRASDVEGQVINVGSNFEISVRDTAAMIAELMGREVLVEVDSRRLRPPSSEVERLWADNTRAAHLLGWTPRYGGREGFSKGLRHTIDWFGDPSNLARYKADLYNV